MAAPDVCGGLHPRPPVEVCTSQMSGLRLLAAGLEGSWVVLVSN